MSQDGRLVHIVDEVPELDAVEPGETRDLTMVVALDGFLDAGNASALAVGHHAGLSPIDEHLARVALDG